MNQQRDLEQNASAGAALVSLVITAAADPSLFGDRLVQEERLERARKAVAERTRALAKDFGDEVVTADKVCMTLAFAAPTAALDYALALQRETRSGTIELRVAIHVGVVDREAAQAFDEMLEVLEQLLKRGDAKEAVSYTHLRAHET